MENLTIMNNVASDYLFDVWCSEWWTAMQYTGSHVVVIANAAANKWQNGHVNALMVATTMPYKPESYP